MKNLFGLIILFILGSCAEHLPQDRLTFKINYQPEKNYRQKIERSSETVVKYSGTAKSLKKLKEMGLKNPTIISRKAQSEAVLKTGKSDGLYFPVTIEYVKASSSDGKPEIPCGSVFRGKCTESDLPMLESVSLNGIDQATKDGLIKSLQNLFSQFAFPKEELKIGQEFSIEKPFTIPMEGSTVEMRLTSKYKLVSITNGIANFDIQQEYVMEPTLMDNSFHGNGKGQGQLVYDIRNTIFLSYALHTELDLTKKLDSFEFVLTAKSSFTQTTTLEKD